MTNSWISQSDLDMMRSDISHLLPNTVVILRPTPVKSDGRSSNVNIPVTGGTLPARIDPIKQNSQPDDLASAAVFKIVWQLTLPYSAPILEGDLIQYQGELYELETLDHLHSWNASRRARIVKIE